MEPKGPNMEPTRAKMEPKGPNIDQKGAERGPKNIEKSMPEKRSAPGRSARDLVIHAGRLFGGKGACGKVTRRL